MIIELPLLTWTVPGIFTSHPTSRALSDGTSVGTLSRYQAVSTEAVPVASLPELDVHRSELWGGR